MSFGCGCGFWIILLDVAHCEEWPADEVTGFDGRQPSGFDWVPAYCMHPFNGLFSGREIVDAVGLAEDVLGLFGRCTGLPSAASLDKRYPIPPTGIPGPYEDRFAFACDEDISFVVYGDPIFGEDGNGADDIILCMKIHG